MKRKRDGLPKPTDWRVTYSDGETVETRAKLLSDCQKKGVEIVSAEYFELGRWHQMIQSAIDRANNRSPQIFKSSGASQFRGKLLPVEQRRVTLRELLEGGRP